MEAEVSGEDASGSGRIKVLTKLSIVCQFPRCEESAVFQFILRSEMKAYCREHAEMKAEVWGMTLPPDSED